MRHSLGEAGVASVRTLSAGLYHYAFYLLASDSSAIWLRALLCTRLVLPLPALKAGELFLDILFDHLFHASNEA